jgi:HlyD family type I secretion membrane fusion protein
VARLLQRAEQLRPAEDALRRQRVVAPAPGRVVGLRVNAPGEVVAPREPVMEIVPEAETLVVEARVPLDAIRHLRPEQPAELRFTTFNSRSTPLVPARLVWVSDDALADPQGPPHYLVHLAPLAPSLRQAGIEALRPGMAAEVFIQTEARTALDYLLAPLTDTIRRAMREPN